MRGLGTWLRRSAWLPTSALTALGCGALIAAHAASFSGCSLDTEGGREVTCSTLAECDDHEVCTTDSCGSDGICVNDPLPDSTIPEGQQDGDCKRVVCQGGQRIAIVDTSDFFNDMNDCTTDSCTADGIALNIRKGEGASCDDGNGHPGSCGTDPEGDWGCLIKCTAENEAEVCQDATTCTEDSCNTAAAVCVREELDSVPVPGATQNPGDCHSLMCRFGAEVDQADDSDLPIDDIDCNEDQCSNGIPNHPPSAINKDCDDGGGHFCDGNGNCVECNDNEQCGDTTANCLCRICNSSHACENKSDGDDAAAYCQVADDCNDRVCDGNGSTRNEPNDTDAPPDNPSPCIDIYCSGGSVHTDNTTASCDDGLYCNGADTCGGGSCSQHAGNPCPDQASGNYSDADCRGTCRESNDDCNGAEPSGSAVCSDGNACTENDACSGTTCTPGTLKPCQDNNPCTNNDCNTSTGDCINSPVSGSCDDGDYCNGADTCSGGLCGQHAGSPCPEEVSGNYSDGNCIGTCRESDEDCDGPEPSGSAVCSDGDVCTSGDHCVGSTCESTPCNDDLYCNGTEHCETSGCVAGTAPCPNGPVNDDDCQAACNETTNACDPEPQGSECDDGQTPANNTHCNSSGVCVID